MKKQILFTAAALSFCMVGCDESDLDIVQKGVDLTQTVESYYLTDDGAKAAIAKVYVDTQKNFAMIGDINGYNYGPYMALTNFQDPDIFMAGTGSGDCVEEREFHDFRYTTDNIVPLGAYTAFYRSIHKCNLVITQVPENGSQVQKTARAEARVMRAFDFMNLAIYWGKPPLVEEILSADSHPANDKSQEEILQWCVDEIDLALNDLDERKDVNDAAGAYKITKGFANAVKGKALIWLGKYAEAKAPLKAVISSGKYALLPGTEMTRILHSDGKGTSESVLEFNYVYGEGMTGDAGQTRVCWNAANTFSWRGDWFQNLSDRVYAGGWGWINPTGKFANDLITNDGEDSYRRKAWIVSYKDLKNDPIWSKPKTINDKGKETGGPISFKEGQVFPCNEGFWPYKFVVHPCQGDLSESTNPQTRNYPIMRYAEILLLYAEACAQTGDNDGLQYLNAIQERANSKTISKSLTLDAVKSEKRFEMWMEGCHSADLIRWGDTKDLETSDYSAPGFLPTGDEGQIVYDTKDGSWDGADYYLKTYGEASLGFKKGKHEFLPFPTKVMDANVSLVQNPGW